MDVFVEQVDGCVDHYEVTQLTLLARSLQEKKMSTSRMVSEKVRIARSGLSFYKGVTKVNQLLYAYICL